MTLEPHVEYLWKIASTSVYVPDDSPSKNNRVIAVVFAPDSVHPSETGKWWDGISEAQAWAVVERNERQIDEAFNRLKQSELKLADAKQFAKEAFPNQCFAVCETAAEIQEAFDYWRSLGGDPVGLSDSDFFELDSYNATVFAHDVSDLWERGFPGPIRAPTSPMVCGEQLDDYDEQAVLWEYVWRWYSHLMTDHERLVLHTASVTQKTDNLPPNMLAFLRAVPRETGKSNPKVKRDLENGVREFKQSVFERLLSECVDSIYVNRCARCNCVVRTPKAKQCLWCGHDWHEK